MKKNNLILGTFLAFTAILYSSCGASSSSDSTSTVKVEDSTSTEKVEGSTESTESGAVVTIGSQVWTSKNLDVATYRNGDVIPQVQDASAWSKLKTGAWCYFKNDASNGTKYGKLYNWYAVNDKRGLAPNGFHIPSDEEWTILTDYLGGEAADGFSVISSRYAGTKMKSSFGWIPCNGTNGNGTNSSGFAGFPGGFRYHDGTFRNNGGAGYWWSATDYVLGGHEYLYAWFRSLSFHTGFVYRGSYNLDYKQNACSVRCLGD